MKTYRLNGNRDFSLEVVGESFHRANLETICGQHGPEGVSQLADASLIIEDDNKFDRNAVRVDIQGMPVGHLSREDASMYRKLFDGMKIPHSVVLLVTANIRGGFLRDGEKADYGVWLDFPSDQSGAAQIKAIAKDMRPKGCLTSLISFPFDLITALIKLTQSLWKTRNGKIIVLGSVAALVVFCCILPLTVPLE